MSKVIVTKSNIDALAIKINEKAGTSGNKTLSELYDVVNEMDVNNVVSDTNIMADKYNTGCDESQLTIFSESTTNVYDDTHTYYFTISLQQNATYGAFNFQTLKSQLAQNPPSDDLYFTFNNIDFYENCNQKSLRMLNTPSETEMDYHKIYCVFNNCKFPCPTSGTTFNTVKENYWYNCTFPKGYYEVGTPQVFYDCQFLNTNYDAIDLSDAELHHCYVEVASEYTTDTNHTDGFQYWGLQDDHKGIIKIYDTRMVNPKIAWTNVATNTCLMMQPESSSIGELYIDGLCTNGGSYSVYFNPSSGLAIENAIIKDFRVGCTAVYGGIQPYPSPNFNPYTDCIKFDYGAVQNLWVGTVRKNTTSGKYEVCVSNDTNVERTLKVIDNNGGTYTFTIPKCLTYDESKVLTDITLNDYPFNILKECGTIDGLLWVKCYDITNQNNPILIRTQSFSTPNVLTVVSNGIYQTKGYDFVRVDVEPYFDALDLVTTKTKTEYMQRETINTDDITAKIYTTDYNYLDITNSGYMTFDFSNIDTNTIGKYYLKVKALNFEDNIEITIINRPSLSTITATKSNKAYHVGDTLSLSDIVVTANFDDDTTMDISNVATIDASNVNMSQIGIYNIDISWTFDGVTKDYQLPLYVTSVPQQDDFILYNQSYTYNARNNGGFGDSFAKTKDHYYEIEFDYDFNFESNNYGFELLLSDNWADTTNNEHLLYSHHERLYTDSGHIKQVIKSTATKSEGAERNDIFWTKLGGQSTNQHISITNLYVREVTFDEPTQKTLTNITANKTKTNYNVDDTLNTNDITTIAHYSDSTSATVTGTYDTTQVNMSVAGNYNIGVSYTENGVTKTTNIAITVSDTPTPPTPTDWDIEWDGTTNTLPIGINTTGNPTFTLDTSTNKYELSTDVINNELGITLNDSISENAIIEIDVDSDNYYQNVIDWTFGIEMCTENGRYFTTFIPNKSNLLKFDSNSTNIEELSSGKHTIKLDRTSYINTETGADVYIDGTKHEFASTNSRRMTITATKIWTVTPNVKICGIRYKKDVTN